MKAAEGVSFAALVVRFETGDEFVFPTDKPTPVDSLQNYLDGEGKPIAIVIARQNDPTSIDTSARLLNEVADDPGLQAEVPKLAKEFHHALRENGFI